jgi:hypothetical protein
VAKAEKDFEELLRLFNKHRVRYCIVGAFAVAFHALPRYTKDLDLLVEPSANNGASIISALNEFGFGSLKLAPEDSAEPRRIIQLGYEPVRIDIATSISGVKFERVWKNRKTGKLGDARAHYIGIEELIRNKKASGRKQDLSDIEILKSARKARS